MQRLNAADLESRSTEAMTADRYSEHPWWKSAVIYEIALISFQDSNGDGKGDLADLISRIVLGGQERNAGSSSRGGPEIFGSSCQ
ncbi:hypothetical protein [Bradyrhizobium sp. DASA03120]|uniref:hypothetical protein n=1 Tax=Bradyrhizobium sp. SMVTL-02 TaxID=3395917 RepID=UPI003F6F17F2